LVLTGLVYAAVGLFTDHFRKHRIPAPGNRNWPAYRGRIEQYLRLAPPVTAARSIPLQATYESQSAP
jgi:thiosulfate reductase cytochrome b subunit